MKELKEILTIIDEAPQRFESQIPDIEKKIFRDVSLLLKDLKVSANGKIEATVENLKLINEIKTKLGKIVVSKQYASLVNKFVSHIPAISNFQTATAGLPAASKKMMSAVAKVQIDNTLENLIGQGYKQAVVSKLYNTLLANVTSGGSYSDLIEQLEKQLITTEEKPGMLSKYAKTYVVDTLGQFAGQGNKMIADALESEWFQYVGSNLTTTREFCRHLTKKRYVHISEFPAILKGKIDGHKCKIYTATGLPYGMKEGTNADNFIENRGGWNCGHELIPVSDLTVPKEIREKMLSRVNESEYKYEPVINIENIIRKNKDFETAVAFDKDGNIIIDKRGQATSVSFTNDEMSKMKNGILTHNHPRGWSSPENSLGRIGNSFSKDDISLAINTDLSEIRAVTPHYTFIMKRPANGWPDLQQSIKEWNQTERVMRNNFDNIISQSNNKKTDIDRINSIYYHKLCKEFSKKYGIEYIKKKTR